MKQLSHYISYSAIAVGLALFVAAGVAHYTDTQNQLEIKASVTDRGLAAATSTELTAAPSLPSPIVPATIAIPSIDVYTVVESVGINRNGNMSVPSSYDTTAWFEPGFKPGEYGNAIIAGHVDNSLGMAGVFIDLDQITLGDEIILQAEDGGNLTFVVSSIDEFDYRTAPLEDIYGQSDVPQIRVITCSGTWIPGLRSYDKRLIVTAQLSV